MNKSKLSETLRKFSLVSLGIFYFVFSTAFIFFQQSKNIHVITAPVFESSIHFSHYASQSNSYAQKIYKHRQRFIDVNRNVFTKAVLLFPLLGFFAFILFTLSLSRYPVFSQSENTSSFPAFLAVASLRI